MSTYPQYSGSGEFVAGRYSDAAGNFEHWCQVIDSSDFFRDASNLSDQGPGEMNQAFGIARASFPTKLSTETVGDFEKAYGS